MAGKRKLHTATFKAQVALAALKGDRTVNELAGHYGVHPTLIHGWKKQLLAGAQGLFAGLGVGQHNNGSFHGHPRYRQWESSAAWAATRKR